MCIRVSAASSWEEVEWLLDEMITFMGDRATM